MNKMRQKERGEEGKKEIERDGEKGREKEEKKR
jgi:hypothetical protein